MSFLIDTNVISEVGKGARCDPHVSAWYASIADEDLFLSTLVLGEIRRGVERVHPQDSGKAAALERWLREVETAFAGRVLAIDNAVSDRWGRMGAARSAPVVDGLLVATALANGLTLVTRNERDSLAWARQCSTRSRTLEIPIDRSVGGERDAYQKRLLAKAFPEPDLKYLSKERAGRPATRSPKGVGWRMGWDSNPRRP